MKLWRMAGGLASALTLVVLSPVSVGTAGAAEQVACGQAITHSITLRTDIGPCTADGLRVVASHITVDLNGHTVTGRNTRNTTEREQVGINLMNVTGVTVTGPGTVQHFDAGVAVNGGSQNQIVNLTARDNVNHVVLTGAMNPCSYGDGIVTDNSTDNVITGNVTSHNGPYDGIALVDASKGNRVSGNRSLDNDVSNILPNGQSGPCGPEGGGTASGRPHQDMGIRVEGPGATANVVSGNTTKGNQAAGISIHGTQRSIEPPNTANLVLDNIVTGNGFAGPGDTFDGILSLPGYESSTILPAFGNTFARNVSSNNARSGIYAGGGKNTIVDNVVNDNVRDGIELFGPSVDAGVVYAGSVDNRVVSNTGHGNGLFDGEDHHPHCDHNEWIANRFGTVNQPCVAAGGGTGTVPPGTPPVVEPTP